MTCTQLVLQNGRSLFAPVQDSIQPGKLDILDNFDIEISHSKSNPLQNSKICQSKASLLHMCSSAFSTHTHTLTHTLTHTHVRTYTHSHTHSHARTHIYTHTHTHTCAHTPTLTHTNTIRTVGSLFQFACNALLRFRKENQQRNPSFVNGLECILSTGASCF
jgi:hypothetical protein